MGWSGRGRTFPTYAILYIAQLTAPVKAKKAENAKAEAALSDSLPMADRSAYAYRALAILSTQDPIDHISPPHLRRDSLRRWTISPTSSPSPSVVSTTFQ
ncbi:hypothetical protein BLNAU_8022 [Blattamonas nauphoetae]|uniref:Uncharacterized protein n=1 Tax=Blattamonas nauphoetae TaxID=2049346 RepID=A0ABQ9XZM6_9EUKA|nr:hypothetical protein BLNAU_8022 [Blattamonas nauphoetae]